MDKCDIRSKVVESFIKRFAKHLCLNPEYRICDSGLHFRYKDSTISFYHYEEYRFLSITTWLGGRVLMVVSIHISDDGIIHIHDKKEYDIHKQTVPLIELFNQEESNYFNPYNDIIDDIKLGIVAAATYVISYVI